MAARPFCHVCMRHYRGSYLVHVGTAAHRARVARRENRGRDVSRRARRIPVATLQSRRDREDAAMVDVHDYYRNPPTPPWPASIRDRVWYVVRYWRRPPGSVSGRSRAYKVVRHRRRRARR